MEKSAWTVGQRKYCKLPSAAQHRLLADLASNALKSAGEGAPGIVDDFIERYRLMQSWAELDTYVPPSWLAPLEALEEYAGFHLLFGAPEENEGPLESTSETVVSWEPRFPVEVALDQVRSPYNIGSVLRLVDNFGLEGLVHASPWLRLDHPRLRRAARGCEHWIPVRCEEDLPGYLRQAGCPVVGIESAPKAIPLHRWDPPPRAVLVLGNETYGLASEVRHCCSEIVTIPMQGYKRSMNVHHALALVVWRMVSGGEGGDVSGGVSTQSGEDLG